MNKYVSISIAFVVSSFLAINIYLLFGEESVIPKSVYVTSYEKLATDDFTEEIAKEAFISPTETTTIYVGSEDDVESWVVTEGDFVDIGDELALLNTEREDVEQEMLNAEHNALRQQERDLQTMLGGLKSDQFSTQSSTSSTVDREENVTEIDGDTRIELGLGVNFTVDVTQEGSYAQAITAVEQQLTDITQKLAVSAAQLLQDPSHPAILSPIEGTVSKVTRSGAKLSVELYSSEKIALTYAKDNEWLEIEENDRVLIQAPGLDDVIEGYVYSVSEVPVEKNNLSNAYKSLDPKKAKNSLAYYEVEIITDNELESLPYGNNVNAQVITNEALDAVSVNEDWTRRIDEESATVMIMNSSGKAVLATVESPFISNGRAVVTDELTDGQIALHSPRLKNYNQPTKIFLPLPTYMPTTTEFRMFGWKNYLEYMLLN